MDNAELISKHLAAFSAGNWDEYKGHLADNVKYEEFSTRTTANGRDEYVRSIKKWKTAFPDSKANVLSSFASGDNVVTELEWTGTHTGPMEGPLGTIAPTNKKGSVRAVIVSKVQNGKIVETRHYFDLMTVLGQMGVLSGIGAQAGQPRQAEARPSAS